MSNIKHLTSNNVSYLTSNLSIYSIGRTVYQRRQWYVFLLLDFFLFNFVYIKWNRFKTFEQSWTYFVPKKHSAGAPGPRVLRQRWQMGPPGRNKGALHGPCDRKAIDHEGGGRRRARAEPGSAPRRSTTTRRRAAMVVAMRWICDGVAFLATFREICLHPSASSLRKI